MSENKNPDATPEEVRHLAALARLSITDEELPKLVREFDSILGYVSKLNDLELPGGTPPTPVVRNVLRDDSEPHATGLYTEKLTGQFPAREGNHLLVKQIISHD